MDACSLVVPVHSTSLELDPVRIRGKYNTANYPLDRVHPWFLTEKGNFLFIPPCLSRLVMGKKFAYPCT